MTAVFIPLIAALASITPPVQLASQTSPVPSPMPSIVAAPTPFASPMHFDALVSAGHEGRPASCAHFKHKCNLGAAGERQWTPVVADEVARDLRAKGFTVAREPADFDGTFDVKAAVFIHFDGSGTPCSTGASIGYHDPGSVPAARAWRALYSHYFPYHFMTDNFTTNLSNYYGFRQVHASAGALVIELGEVTCPSERAWLASRLKWEGDLIAQFIEDLIANPPKGAANDQRR